LPQKYFKNCTSSVLKSLTNAAARKNGSDRPKICRMPDQLQAGLSTSQPSRRTTCPLEKITLNRLPRVRMTISSGKDG